MNLPLAMLVLFTCGAACGLAGSDISFKNGSVRTSSTEPCDCRTDDASLWHWKTLQVAMGGGRPWFYMEKGKPKGSDVELLGVLSKKLGFQVPDEHCRLACVGCGNGKFRIINYYPCFYI